MFRCHLCGHLSQPGEPATHLVLATRTHHHPYRPRAMKRRSRTPWGTRGELIYRDDPGGIGSQIVHEVLTHAHCAALHALKQAHPHLRDEARFTPLPPTYWRAIAPPSISHSLY